MSFPFSSFCCVLFWGWNLFTTFVACWLNRFSPLRFIYLNELYQTYFFTFSKSKTFHYYYYYSLWPFSPMQFPYLLTIGLDFALVFLKTSSTFHSMCNDAFSKNVIHHNKGNRLHFESCTYRSYPISFLPGALVLLFSVPQHKWNSLLLSSTCRLILISIIYCTKRKVSI